MINFGYNNRWIRLVKDILFVAIALFLMVRGRIVGFIVGLLFAFWYGRDAWFQAKALWQEKTYEAPDPTPSAPADDKITLSQDAREVDFEKE